jgi:proteasome lid subunit RPN8/RPN11
MMQCLPYEGVGLLAARRASRRLIANRFYAGRNIDASAERYTMDPVDVHVALEDMEQRGLRLLAIVHSHPHTPPVPSVVDLAEAELPGVLSVIVGLTPVVDMRAWRIVFSQGRVAVRGEEVRIENGGDTRCETGLRRPPIC